MLLLLFVLPLPPPGAAAADVVILELLLLLLLLLCCWLLLFWLSPDSFAQVPCGSDGDEISAFRDGRFAGGRRAEGTFPKLCIPCLRGAALF